MPGYAPGHCFLVQYQPLLTHTALLPTLSLHPCSLSPSTPPHPSLHPPHTTPPKYTHTPVPFVSSHTRHRNSVPHLPHPPSTVSRPATSLVTLSHALLPCLWSPPPGLSSPAYSFGLDGICGMSTSGSFQPPTSRNLCLALSPLELPLLLPLTASPLNFLSGIGMLTEDRIWISFRSLFPIPG